MKSPQAQPQERDIASAIENLQTNQRQLDQDGVYVGVSRQALEEVLAWIGLDLPRLRAQPSPREVALEELLDAAKNYVRCHRRPFPSLINAMADAADEITRLRRALREIAYARPAGATPKTVSGELIERIEKIALAALASDGREESR